MSKSVWLICPAYWQDHNRHLKIEIIKFFFTQTERKKGYREGSLPPHSYSATVAPPPLTFCRKKPVKPEKNGKTGKNRISPF